MLAEVHTEGRLLEAVLVLVKPGARGPARAALGDHLAPLWSLLRVWGGQQFPEVGGDSDVPLTCRVFRAHVSGGIRPQDVLLCLLVT